MNQTLAPGKYTLQIHIPTAQRKSITLTKELVVAGEGPSFGGVVIPPVIPTEPEPEVVEVTFDDITNHWAKKEIEALASNQ